MKTWAVGILAGFGWLVASDAVQAESKKAAVKIVNKSDWEIHEFYLSPAGPGDDWGPDQLKKAVIAEKTGTFTLQQIPCDTYDVKLVDEEGDECEVLNVDICGGAETWTISNDKLLKCQKETED